MGFQTVCYIRGNSFPIFPNCLFEIFYIWEKWKPNHCFQNLSLDSKNKQNPKKINSKQNLDFIGILVFVRREWTQYNMKI